MADARVRAEHEPLRLLRNWAMAVLIFLLWMAGLEYSAYLAITTWGECGQGKTLKCCPSAGFCVTGL